MDCSCTVPMDLDDRVEFMGITMPKARKEHMCMECGRTILPKEVYIKEAFVWENRMTSHKTCEDCYSIRQVFFSNGWEYGGVRVMMGEFIWECRGDLSVPCILQLTKPARDWVLDLVEHVWNEIGEDDEGV